MKKLVVTIALALGLSVTAQVKIGDNPTAIGTSSLLELEGANKALLITRVPTVASITTPVNGMIVYEIINDCFKGYFSGKWSGCGFTEPTISSTGGTGVVASYGAPSCTANVIAGKLAAGIPVTGVTMTIYANVTTLGTYSITAGPTNGVFFIGYGTFTALGCQPIVLTASGIPTTVGVNTYTTNSTPAATATGTTVNVTSGGTATVSGWTCNTTASGQLYRGIAVSGVTQTITATVTTAGTYNISVTANGITFAAAGTFLGTGAQNVVLTATGTPVATGFYPNPLPTTPSCSFNRQTLSNAPLGSTYTALFNGVVSGTYTGTATTVTHSTGETFNNFTATGCDTKPISAGGCAGLTTVTGVSGTVYNLVNINGQCWFKENLKEVPPVYSSYGLSSWGATSPSDVGYWGYYNTTDATGGSGWNLSEPAAGVGLLYQWSAAMNSPNRYDNERNKGACPTGFHIPSHCEWSYLEHGLGMRLSDNTLTGWRGSGVTGGYVGSKLGSQGFNASGFTALLTGYRDSSGVFHSPNLTTYFWTSSSSTSDISKALVRVLDTSENGVASYADVKAAAFSVRCLKD